MAYLNSKREQSESTDCFLETFCVPAREEKFTENSLFHSQIHSPEEVVEADPFPEPVTNVMWTDPDEAEMEL